MVIGKGFTDRLLTQAEIRGIICQGLAQIDVAGKRVFVIIPDGTRSGPVPLMFHLLSELLSVRGAKVDFLIALGTHRRMSEEDILEHLGISREERYGQYAQVEILNHDWQNGLREIGIIPAAEIRELSQGFLDQHLHVEVNERIFDYDRLIICGPVFPHEVVGFSGGNKYFFPGISGETVIELTHWLASLIGNLGIIGKEETPVRRIIDRAASYIQMPKSCFSMVVKRERDLAGLYFGSPEESQAQAAALSARVNVCYVERTYHTVLCVMPDIYDDFWTACKGMFKAEPVVADGGTLIIYAPHIDEVSYTHGAALDRIGYHVRDYYLAHEAELTDVSPLVIGHAVLVKGAGSYQTGVEKPRINVALATRIPPERCERINLSYVDPTTVHPEEWMGHEKEDVLVIPRAGEVLYCLRE